MGNVLRVISRKKVKGDLHSQGSALPLAAQKHYAGMTAFGFRVGKVPWKEEEEEEKDVAVMRARQETACMAASPLCSPFPGPTLSNLVFLPVLPIAAFTLNQPYRAIPRLL